MFVLIIHVFKPFVQHWNQTIHAKISTFTIFHKNIPFDTTTTQAYNIEKNYGQVSK